MRKAEYFFRLSPDLVLDALDQAGLEPSGQCMILNSMENRVYQVVLESGETVVVKFYRPGRWSKEQILDEHRLLFELKKDDIPVCEPLRFYQNQSLFETENLYFAVWPLTGGREPAEFDDEKLLMLGRLLSRMHTTASRCQIKSRHLFNEETILLQGWQNIVASSLMPANLEQEYQAEVNLIKQAYADRAKKVPLQPIHGDFHLGNLLEQNDQFKVLDFDDCCIGPVVQDIWMLMQYTGNDGNRQLQLIIEGYRQFADFSNDWIDLIEVLRATRFVHYSGWVAKRWDDPAFKVNFPHFGEADYWFEELRTLQNQRANFDGNQITPVSESEELTNKDFFWDYED